MLPHGNQVICLHCAATIASGAAACPECGMVVTMPARPRRFIDQRMPIIILLFGAMGVLGLPLLWYSRGFSSREKIWLSMVVVAYTALLVGLATGSCMMAWREFIKFTSS